MPALKSAFGRLRLHYEHDGQPHTVGVNLTALASYSDGAAMQSAADDLSAAFCNIQPGSVAYISWDSLDPYDNLVLSGGYTGARVGLGGVAGADWKSFTVTYTGKEVAPGADGKYGNTEVRLFVGGAYAPNPGQMFFTGADGIALSIVATFLKTDPRFWAGFHGVKASVRGNYPVQFNAHEQRKRGC